MFISFLLAFLGISFLLNSLCTLVKIYSNYNGETLWQCMCTKIHSYGYIWDPTCILKIPPHSQTHALGQIIMQVTQSQCPSVPSSDTACMSVSHSLTLRLSVSLSALTLSVIAGCVPAYLSGHLFAVSDSRSCLYLTVDDVLFCLCV